MVLFMFLVTVELKISQGNVTDLSGLTSDLCSGEAFRIASEIRNSKLVVKKIDCSFLW